MNWDILRICWWFCYFEEIYDFMIYLEFWKIHDFMLWRVYDVLIYFGFGKFHDFMFPLGFWRGLWFCYWVVLLVLILIYKMRSFMISLSTYFGIVFGNSFKLWFELLKSFIRDFWKIFLSNEVEMILFMKCRISSLLVLLFIYKRAIRMDYHPSIYAHSAS